MNAVFNKSNIRLLLVEGDRADRLACKYAFAQHQDFTCLFLEAETGNQGLKLARSQKPDCILLDYHLPDLSGEEFLAELADDKGELPVPVVLITGSDNPKIVADALKIGVSDYVIKDWSWESLQWLSATVFRVMREYQAIREKEAAFVRLREAEAKYRMLVEQISAIAYTASLETPGKLLYLSPQIHQLGFPSEYWSDDSRGFLKRIHANDLSVTIDAYAQTYEHHIPLRCEYRLVRSDGQTRWFLDEANVVRDPTSGRLILQGILVDITKNKENEQEIFCSHQRLEELVRQRTEQLEKQCAILKSANANLDKVLFDLRQSDSALNVSEERFRLLLESAGEGILGLDVDGCCTFVNRAALRMLGYSQEELLGQDVHATLCHNSSDVLSTLAEQSAAYNAIRNGIPQRSTGAFLRRDGSILSVEYSFYPIKLDGRIDGAVLIFWDVTESQALIQRLSYQASHDPLTGLINRTEFERRLTRVIASALKDQSEHTLCYLDLDHFKYINDTCGHAAGDELLRAIGATFSSKLRQRDTLARIGGDEFTLLLEHTSLNQAWHIAKELCECIRNFHFTWAGKDYSVSVSIGIAALPKAEREIAVVLGAADTACYMAKKQGRNQVFIFKAEGGTLFEKSA